MNNFNNNNTIPVNLQYGSCFLDGTQRNSVPSSDTYGNGTLYNECLYNGSSVSNILYPETFKPFTYKPEFIQEKILPDHSNLNLQNIKNYNDKYSLNNPYIKLASDTLGYKPDLLLALYFSDSNLNHLQQEIINKTRENTTNLIPEGVTIQVNIDDLFSHLIARFRDKRVYNGSICFVNNNKDTHQELINLNSGTIDDYVTKMISQLNMYMYYYKDASQLPEQLSIPELTSMKGSRSLEYNNGLYSGNSIGVANFSQRNNII
jgi:hypothetical protein